MTGPGIPRDGDRAAAPTTRRQALAGLGAAAAAGVLAAAAPYAQAAESVGSPIRSVRKDRTTPGTGALKAPPAILSANYRLAFADDFADPNLARINEDGRIGKAPAARAVWRSRLSQPRKDIINQEKQIYVDPQYAGSGRAPLGINPYRIDDGVLSLIAEPVRSDVFRKRLYGQAYTSGCISSEFSHAQRYGYFEIRARLPIGRGFWPAFWMLPTRDAWPPEIDIMEASGDRPGQVHCAVRNPGDKRGEGSGWQDVAVGAGGWQTFACEWTDRKLEFFANGRPVWRVDNHRIHEPMYLIANLALGSHDENWIPDPDASTPFPARFEIDYIRAFARA